MLLGLAQHGINLMTNAPWAAYGSSPSLEPPTPLFEITEDDIERAGAQLDRFMHEFAEVVKAFEFERGMGSSAASYYAAKAVRNRCDDFHHDYVNEN